MSRTLPSLDPWPNGKPLPTGGITIIYDPATNLEYRLDLSRLGGGATPYYKESYTAGTSGAQTLTSAELPGLDTAALIVSVGVRGVDAQGTPTLDPLPSSSYSLAGGILRVVAAADIDKDDVLEVQWLTAGQLAAAGVSLTQLQALLVAGPGVTITLQNGQLLVSATTVTAVPKAPAAPTNGQVNDTAKEFTFKVNPAYPSYTQYKENGRPGTTAPAYLSAATAYQVGDTVHVTGLAGATKQSLAYYVAGSGNVPDGQALTNTEAFSGAPVVVTPTPDLTAALAISLATVTLGSPVSFSVTPSGGTAPYGYEVVATDTATGQQFTLGTTKAGSWTPATAGSYELVANVTDSSSPVKMAQSATRYLQVAQAANRIPVADAGSDVTMQLPTSSVALMGRATDADGDAITGHAWRQITGPNSATGLPASTQNVVASNLVEGTYQFGYRATDSRGGVSDEDLMLVTVQAAASGADPSVSEYLFIIVGDSFEVAGDPGSAYYTGPLWEYLGRPANVTRKFYAFPGQTSKWFIDNQLSNALAEIDFAKYRQVVVLIHYGTNDLSTNNAGSRLASTAAANNKYISQQFRAKARPGNPVSTALLPTTNRGDGATITFNADRKDLNSIQESSWTTYANAWLQPSTQLALYGDQFPSGEYTRDTVHTNEAGADIMGIAAAELVRPFLGIAALVGATYAENIGYTPPSANNDPPQKLPALGAYAMKDLVISTKASPSYYCLSQSGTTIKKDQSLAAQGDDGQFNGGAVGTEGLNLVSQLGDIGRLSMPVIIPANPSSAGGLLIGWSSVSTGRNYEEILAALYKDLIRYRYYEGGNNIATSENLAAGSQVLLTALVWRSTANKVQIALYADGNLVPTTTGKQIAISDTITQLIIDMSFSNLELSKVTGVKYGGLSLYSTTY